MKTVETPVLKLKLYFPETFRDFRGQYVETWNRRAYFDDNRMAWVQDDFSFSTKGVLRGLHGDNNTWKLVQIIRGHALLTVVDCRDQSPTYKKWDTVNLDDVVRAQVLIPPRFANGHLCVSDDCIFHYKQSEYYDRDSQFTLRWSDYPEAWDAAMKIIGIEDPILSNRDRHGPFKELT